ncbi:hypothetical protein [Cupriavidus necator]|uniref:Uncharacterized protein n=1 Tax=Cupriavidus pinatubonensis (strain JMP 134 / LMG 1197) TaxID=264198 RepID=Q46NK1_CUPPJ|nr:hypothetical protein [Cupriavidus necator]
MRNQRRKGARRFSAGGVPGERRRCTSEVGEFIVGLTEAERAERYAMCLDLVRQLAVYCRRKAVKLPARSPNDLLDWVERGVRNKQGAWQLGRPEVDWIVEQMRQAYKTTLDGFEDLENLK